MFGKTETENLAYCMTLYEEQKYNKAEKICRKILKKNSTNQQALISLGNILFMQQKYDEALIFYKQAEANEPDSFLPKINIANLFVAKENYSQAEQYARQCLKLDSQSYMALNILGTSLMEQEHFEEALTILLQAQKENPKDAWLYNYLSQCYQQKGMIKEALEAGWQAIKLAPKDENQHINFGYMLYELSLDYKDKIIQKYTSEWLKNFPQNVMAEHMGQALLNKTIPEKANREYVQKIFDVFASDFDDVLADLEYQTPQIISDFMREIYGMDSHPKLYILDIGCGTGLCGKFLKPYAGFLKLEGVDISPEMLKKAKLKKIYNRLFCQDIVEFLQTKKSKYDLIVAADVLTYFGRLDLLFEQMQKALKKQGRILFSITSNDETDSEYILHQSGRYKHHQNYVHNLLQKNGFSVEKEEQKTLRKEAEKEVKGYIISAKKI